jgi:hypothetical protein
MKFNFKIPTIHMAKRKSYVKNYNYKKESLLGHKGNNTSRVSCND